MERAGIDGFVVTTNIDLGVGGNHPLAIARTVRTCSQLPAAVSGGFSPADDALTSSGDWDIVSRSVADAVAPADMAQEHHLLRRRLELRGGPGERERRGRACHAEPGAWPPHCVPRLSG